MTGTLRAAATVAAAASSATAASLGRGPAALATRCCWRRNLSLHEHVSADLLAKYNVAIPRGKVARSPAEAAEAAKQFGGSAVVKAQVLAGGRGKGRFTSGYQGGVKVCGAPAEAEAAARAMIGQRLVTKQTGAAGKPCDLVYVCQKLKPRREYYFAIMLDRQSRSPMLVGSAQGGMDIEAVAAKSPDAIVKHAVTDPTLAELTMNEAVAFARRMGFKDDGGAAASAAEAIRNLYRLFHASDATLVEINPMAEVEGGPVVCMDCKINIDDNADFRQQAIFATRDVAQEDPREVAAAAARLNYIGLDGAIGCLVNGAGLAMATMDMIKLHGGEPANFLDVGGSATANQVSEAFRIITSDGSVRSILVNIFGGIMRCDTIAQGIIEATRTLNLKVPLIVRLQGTMVDRAREMLRESGLAIHAVDDLDAAARLAVKLSGSKDGASATA